MASMETIETIQHYQRQLTLHPVYHSFNRLEGITHFMRYHVFAVWDFMSLLKALQHRLTCVSVPWRPSGHPPEVVRLINQIVLGEESDLDQHGHPTSHFELYLKGMEEIGAPIGEMREFVSTLDMNLIPQGAREFVKHNLQVAQHGHIVEVAASFFYGREKLIPDMFEAIVATLKKEKVHAPTFLYYLERHIEVDGGEHGPLALRCLDHLTHNDEALKSLALSAGTRALKERQALWDYVNAHCPR
jgi:hypothetical protein